MRDVSTMPAPPRPESGLDLPMKRAIAALSKIVVPSPNSKNGN